MPEVIFEILKSLPKQTHPMDGQRTALSALAGYDEHIEGRNPEANKEKAYQLLGQLPTITVNSYQSLTEMKSFIRT